MAFLEVQLTLHMFYLFIIIVAHNVNYRLPNNTKPETYDVTLATSIHKGQFNFTGTVIIVIRVLENNTNVITLQTRQLMIDSVDLFNDGKTFINSVFKKDEITEFLHIKSAETLKTNVQYHLKIKYNGELRDDWAGFYRASYVNANGETK